MLPVMADLLMDLASSKRSSGYRLLGVGHHGTGASLCCLTVMLGEGLDEAVCKKMGFEASYAVTGQTYPRKFDTMVLNVLAMIAQSAYKFSNDLRLLQSLKEIEEPFEKQQIGSSAMAYKRNPMRSERMGALCRFVLSLPANAAVTASTQWFERTLTIRRTGGLLSAGFLAVDAILNLYLNISSGGVREGIQNHINQELPFMAPRRF